MILETIVTSRNIDGSINVSPMGATVSVDESRFELRPFDTSTTYLNLKRTREGILHITDDVDLIARAAIGALLDLPPLVPGRVVDVAALATACRWYEFKVDFIDDSGPRIGLNCQTLHQHRHRDFVGFNRAKHAVLESAILATRLNFLPFDEVREQFQRYALIVNKTGGPQEHAAFQLLQEFVATHQQ